MFSPVKIVVFFISIVILLVFDARSLNAQTSSYGELQAAYMFNFAKYISWPGEKSSFVIGIFGETDILEDLQTTLKGKKVSGKEIQLRKIDVLEKVIECQIVYLPSSASGELASLLKVISGKNILLVTEDDLIKKGASISFIIDDDKLRFKLSKSVLLKSGLEASEGLLRLAILM